MCVRARGEKQHANRLSEGGGGWRRGVKGGEERRGRRDNGSRGKKGEKEREKGLLQEMLERREEGGRREG